MFAQTESSFGALQDDLVIFDMEMTGGSVIRHEILEIAAYRIRLSDFTLVATFNTKVKPLRARMGDRKALRMTHYSEAAWAQSWPLYKVIRYFAKFVQGATLAGWALTNDMAFLKEGARRLKFPLYLGENYLDIQKIAMQFYGLKQSPGLKSIALENQLVGQFHSADFDAFCTTRMLQIMLEQRTLESFDSSSCLLPMPVLHAREQQLNSNLNQFLKTKH